MLRLQRIELVSTTTSSMNKNKGLDPLRAKKTFIGMEDDWPDCPDTTIYTIIIFLWCSPVSDAVEFCEVVEDSNVVVEKAAAVVGEVLELSSLRL